jgi:hypothetical protein
VGREADAVNRLGLVLKAFFNPFHQFQSDKPFNPIEGEFIGF